MTDEGPVHEVTVSPFRIGKYLVTRKVWRAVMGKLRAVPWGEHRPVDRVSWYDAVAFCNRASLLAGLEPCYEVADEVTWHRERDGYRLPTEAEWEYACRAGTTTRHFFGDTDDQLYRYAWYTPGPFGRASRPPSVGEKLANRWGLHDMVGSVDQWCWDWYRYYADGSQLDPEGPAEGWERVVRGGGGRSLRSSSRSRAIPRGPLAKKNGLRCARGARLRR